MNFRHVIEQAYEEILLRAADAGGLEGYNGAMNDGLTEAELREDLLRSSEYARRFLEGGEVPPPPPPPAPGGGAIRSLTLSPSRRGFLLNDKLWTIASHGNVVTAIPGHDWRGDVALQVAHGESYARLWHILAGDTPVWGWPWQWNGSRWDLTAWNETYWSEKRAVMAECDARGIVLEVHIFDRGCGGSQADYKAYPWHPDANVNGLRDELPIGGTGAPEFYALKPRTTALQAAYAQKWIDEMRPFKGVIAEIDNEYRGDGFAWPKRMASIIKTADPNRLVAHSSLGNDLEAAYGEPKIDIVCKHFGDEGNDPRTLHDYLARHWSLGKVVNIDEFANGLGDKTLLAEMCDTIVRQGGHFHIEDSKAVADGYGAASAARALIAQKSPPPFFDVGPTGPSPPCPKEIKRGPAFYRADWPGGSAVGHQACVRQNAIGFPRGAHIAFDSTPLTDGGPMPPGCPVVQTVWTITPPNPMRTTPDENFAMQSKFLSPGTFNVCAKGSAAAVCLAVKIK